MGGLEYELKRSNAFLRNLIMSFVDGVIAADRKGRILACGIIENHQGIISVHSHINKGTTFSIRLPLKRRLRKGEARDGEDGHSSDTGS